MLCSKLSGAVLLIKSDTNSVSLNCGMGLEKEGGFESSGSHDFERVRRSLNRQPKSRFTPASIGTVFQREFAAMRLGDLAAKNKTNARATGLRCEERNEQVCSVGKAWAIIENPNIE